MGTNTDSTLIDGLVLGDPAAADEFVRGFRPRVLALVAAARVPAGDREDVAQDALRGMLISLARGHFDRRATLKTWVFVSTSHQIVNYWRRMRRMGAKMPISDDRIRRGRWETPEALLLMDEVLTTLPAAHRKLFNRVELRGEPVAVVASTLALSTRSGYAILHTIRAKLRDALLDRPTRSNCLSAPERR